MAKKLFNHFINLVISLLFVFTLFSCQVEWNGKFEDELGAYLSSRVEFYNGDVYLTAKYYMIGKKLTASDLPDETDSIIASAKPGYRITGWNMIYPTDVSVDSYTTNGINEIATLTVTNKIAKLNSNWIAKTDTPYKINYLLQNIDDNYYTFFTSENRTGTTDEEIDFSSLKTIEHFTVESSSLPIGTTISGYGDTEVDVLFTRDEYTFSFHDTGSPIIETGRYEATVSDAIKAIQPSPRAGYRFYGWSNQELSETFDNYDEAMEKVAKIPDTFQENLDFYPVWGPVTYKITIKDQFGKPLSGICVLAGATAISGVDNEYLWSNDGDVNLIAPALDSYLFDGFYINNEDCDDASSKLTQVGSLYTLSRSTTTGDIAVYVKWSYPNIYVDPENGNDNNTGVSKGKVLKTITEALKYDFTNIYLCSALTDPDDIVKLNGLADYSFTITRYSDSDTIDFPFIHIKPGVIISDTDPLRHVLLDGGAKWEEDTNGDCLFTKEVEDVADKNVKKKNTGKKSTTPLIINEGTLNIGEAVTLQNNHNTSSSTGGGAIYNTGTLNIIGNSLSGLGVYIKNNYAAANGGGISNVSDKNMTLQYLELNNNASATQGGAIYINTSTFNASSIISMNNVKIIANRSTSSGGGIYSLGKTASNRSFIDISYSELKYNYTANVNGNSGTGGALYSNWTNSEIKNSTISNNASGANGGGLTLAQGVSSSISGTTVEANIAGSNGGGISGTGGSGGVLTLGAGTIITGNSATSNGSGLYLSNKNIVFDGGYVASNNNLYFTISNIQIKFTDSAKTDSSNYSGYISELIPDSYSTTEQIVKLDSGVTLISPLSSLFTVKDDSNGKKWKINDSGYLEEVIETTSAGGDISNPFETKLEFSLKPEDVNGDTTSWWIQLNIDDVHIEDYEILTRITDLSIKLYIDGIYTNIKNSPGSNSVQKPQNLTPDSGEKWALVVTGIYKETGLAFKQTLGINY